MPRQTVWMIRTALLCFLVGIVLGGVMLSGKAFAWQGSLWFLLPIHIELTLIGWVVQLVMGTAYWILPRYLKRPGRGDPRHAWLMVIMLNVGIWLVILSHLNLLPELSRLAGRICEVGAVGMFVALHWKRVVAYQRGH